VVEGKGNYQDLETSGEKEDQRWGLNELIDFPKSHSSVIYFLWKEQFRDQWRNRKRRKWEKRGGGQFYPKPRRGGLPTHNLTEVEDRTGVRFTGNAEIEKWRRLGSSVAVISGKTTSSSHNPLSNVAAHKNQIRLREKRLGEVTGNRLLKKQVPKAVKRKCAISQQKRVKEKVRQ